MAKLNPDFVAYLKKFKNHVWDWNGTLLNDVEVIYQAEKTQFERHGKKILPLKERRKVFGHPVQKYYEAQGFCLVQHSFDDLSKEFITMYEDSLDQASIFAGTIELLTELKKHEINLYIVSAAPEKLLHKSIQQMQLQDFFIDSYGLPDSKGESKIARAKELFSKYNISKDETVFIGDTDHDFEVAQALNSKALLVADGHQDLSRFDNLNAKIFASRYL